jgi:hypothetical protein
MKVAHVRFRDAPSRRTYLVRLRKRMYAAGHSPDYVTKWIRARFGPRLPVTYVFGQDDAERADDAALELPGVSCKIEEDDT